MIWLKIGSDRIVYERIGAVLLPDLNRNHVLIEAFGKQFRYEAESPEGKALTFLFGDDENLNGLIVAFHHPNSGMCFDLVAIHQGYIARLAEKPATGSPAEQFRAYMESDNQENVA